MAFVLPAEVREKALKRKEEREQRLQNTIFNNERLVDLMVSREYSEENLQQIEGLVTMCRELPPIQLEGRAVKVNIYPVNEARFGKEIGLLLGLITSASTALEQHQTNMLAITGISPILAEKIRIAIGSAPYFSARSKLVVDGYVGNAEELQALLMEATSIMGLHPIDVTTIRQSDLELMYTKGQIKADIAYLNHQKLSELSATDAMTYEE